MKIFVINLESCKERKEYIKKKVSYFPFDVEFINAVDGNKLNDSALRNNVFGENHITYQNAKLDAL